MVSEYVQRGPSGAYLLSTQRSMIDDCPRRTVSNPGLGGIRTSIGLPFVRIWPGVTLPATRGQTNNHPGSESENGPIRQSEQMISNF